MQRSASAAPARRRVVPQPDRGVKVVGVKFPDPLHHHRDSVTSAVIRNEADNRAVCRYL
jgi:hypothetical protein